MSAGQPQLVESRWQLRNMQAEAQCGFKIEAQGFGPGEMVWQGTPERSYEIFVQRSGASLTKNVVKADATGTFSIKLEADAIEPLEVRVVCSDG